MGQCCVGSKGSANFVTPPPRPIQYPYPGGGRRRLKIGQALFSNNDVKNLMTSLLLLFLAKILVWPWPHLPHLRRPPARTRMSITRFLPLPAPSLFPTSTQHCRKYVDSRPTSLNDLIHSIEGPIVPNFVK